MTRITVEQYIESVKAILSSKLDNTITLAGRELTFKFIPQAIAMEGYITATFSIIGGKMNVRIAFLNDIGTKKDSITFRDLDTSTLATQIISFVTSKEEDITRKLDDILAFRNELSSEMEQIEFTRECDSKHMSSYTSKSMNVIVKYNDDGSFKANFSKTRKRSPTKEIFVYEAQAIKEQAATLAAMVKMKDS